MPEMYERFKGLDGSHPWREVSPDAFIDYRAYHRPHGHVIYFNFPLAREMELIPEDHPARINEQLVTAILETFSLRIINEYDLSRRKKHPPEGAAEPRLYMATRYLQMQHKNKQGKNSGDGRSIWNGYVKSKNLTFDVSSRGTGATVLSPGAQEADGPVKTGDNTYGYSSGLADLEEMLATAVMSEIFYRQSIPTERTLAVISYRDGTAIGVRTAPNLIRPAHIFRYLKQGRHKELKASLDYFIRRQVKNGFWKLPAADDERYLKALGYIARSYGKMSAVLEEEYIFNWLAWDGDNMLASGAILDYGSIRQFAAKHDKYRYEDVDRFSASLTEQRYWARVLVQVFAQAVSFVVTGKKENLRLFKSHECLSEYDHSFETERDWRMLWRIGFTPDQIKHLMREARSDVKEFRRALSYFEDRKISKGIEKLPDGLTHRPVFMIRRLLRELPGYYIAHGVGEDGTNDSYMPPDTFCQIMAASYVKRKDLRMTPARISNVKNFQNRYWKLVLSSGESFVQVLSTLRERSAIINDEHRMTGDGMTWIIDEVIAIKGKITFDELQEALDAFIDSQVLIPGEWQPIPIEEAKSHRLKSRLFVKIQANLEEYKESI